MKSKNRPVFHTRLTTYQDLDDYAHAFAEQHLGLLILLGSPGVGKSRVLRERIGDQACWIAGNASPFGIYIKCYEHRDAPIVLDDVDGLARDRQGIRLLKSLCQSDPEKTVGWCTLASALEKLGVPQTFKTKSQVAIVANTWFFSEDIQALEDRGHVVVFEPPPLEVHRKAGTWYWNQEIFDFVANHLHLITQPSLRMYITAWECMQAGLPWQSAILDRCLSGAAGKVAKLRADRRYATEEERVRAFVEGGFGCRATYFNHAKKLRPSEAVPRIVLARSAPPVAANSGETLIEILKRRNKGWGQG